MEEFDKEWFAVLICINNWFQTKENKYIEVIKEILKNGKEE